ncbi:VanZ family protein [Oxalobacteraceae bacterium R-40]|uniref:VanZ family protein n=1 Tax=Keguizhuia sedimenti TaxID=3064264 RepID=A0ABU1BL42_9BURK|nr:VanZ family protein [Oxalobacteraceae bacterium R-40]
MASPTSSEKIKPSEAFTNASVFARVGLLVYTILIVYASWYPFSGWQDKGLTPWHYLSLPLPHYWTKFDVAANILAYIPFGIGVVFAMHPHVRRIFAFLLASAAGVLLSGIIEAGQTFLPSRVPSNLDLFTNSAGAILGALVGVLLMPYILERSRLMQLRRRWFLHEASRGLIVAGLWPLAQIYPQSYLFGHGQLTPILSEWLSFWWSTPVDLSGLILQDRQLTIEQYWLAETIITACGFTGALLTLLCILRKTAPKVVLVVLLALSAFAAKALSNALLFSPEQAFVWLTPGAQAGILVSLIMLGGLVFAPPTAQRRVAALTLIISLIVVNAAPANPYFVATLQSWVQGKLQNFNGAVQFLGLAWPFFALWFLYHPVHRKLKQT